MSIPSDRRSRKRLATRQTISDTATLLFCEKGFDNVTVDEIAAAADVGRMTVFNYFPRKEDMFFDRDEESRELLRNAIRHRSIDISPFESLRLLAHRLINEQNPFVEFSARSQSFIETIQKSETLKARARAIRDELTQVVKLEVSKCTRQEAVEDPNANLAAALFLATWTVAFTQAHRIFRETQNEQESKTIFLSLVDRGIIGLKTTMAGTPYV